MSINSVIVGTNADAIRAAAELYIEPGDIVVDATYGKGNFWTKTPGLPTVAHDRYKLDGVDLRALPEKDASVDVLVLDPPYRPEEWTPHASADFADRYGIDATELRTPDDVLELYTGGIREAARVLNKRGRLFVKLQDAIHGCGFYPMLNNVTRVAGEHGLETLDVFVVFAGTGPGSGSWARQHRSRRAHSYLVIFARSRYWQHRTPRELPRCPEALTFELGATP